MLRTAVRTSRHETNTKTSVNTFGAKIPKVINLQRILTVFLLALQVTVNPNSSAASEIHDVCIYNVK